MLAVISLFVALQLLQSSAASGGVHYIRWGRTVCPNGASVIYKGYAGGSHYGEVGSGQNLVCMPENPQWGNVVPGYQAWTGYMDGVQYQLEGPYKTDGIPFSFENHAGVSIDDENAPCVACYRPHRRAVLMIPARVNCSAEGWNMEYTGYLVSSDRGRYRSSYNCLDVAPEVIPGGQGVQRGQDFFPVQAKCGSLPCPDYVESYEIACAVCSI